MKIEYTKAVIFLNGTRPDTRVVQSVINEYSYIIGCDGGTEHVRKLQYVPDAIIGDLDSISKVSIALFSKDQHRTRFITYGIDKDYTDSELAIDHAVSLGIKNIVVVGMLGSRLDHMLGNLFLLTKHKYRKLNLKIIEKNQEIYAIRSDTTIKGQKGDLISLMPLAGSAVISKCSGLKYDLSRYTISQQSNYGISNVMTDFQARLHILHGLLIVIHHTNQLN
jgi:thiamine pyrophosphokinase